jgi:signal transduction histidine kinase
VTENDRQSSWLSFALNLLGIAVVVYWAVRGVTPETPLWIIWGAAIALAAWLVRSVIAVVPLHSARISGIELGVECVGLAAGSLTTGGTNGLLIVPVAIVLVALVADVTRPLIVGLALAAAAAVLVVLSTIPFDVTVWGLLSMESAILVATLVGVSRRQFRESEQQVRLLRERELDVREERAQVQLLADRQLVARDIHDVLAHSLGGLVIQLDAVEALLETGDTNGALRRVADARALAASGLGEARRAVAALREPTDVAATAPTQEDFAAAVTDLIEAHRSLGGTIDFVETGTPRDLDTESATAIRRALQESLSNARKHAPRQPVSARLDWGDDAVRLRLANPLAPRLAAAEAAAAEAAGSAGLSTRAGVPAGSVVSSGSAASSGSALSQGGAASSVSAVSQGLTAQAETSDQSELSATGGGHGLVGMRERFAALPNGGSVTAETHSGEFVVVAEAKLS